MCYIDPNGVCVKHNMSCLISVLRSLTKLPSPQPYLRLAAFIDETTLLSTLPQVDSQPYLRLALIMACKNLGAATRDAMSKSIEVLARMTLL